MSISAFKKIPRYYTTMKIKEKTDKLRTMRYFLLLGEDIGGMCIEF